MSYIQPSDIKDVIANGMALQPYILESDDALEDIAEQVGCAAADIEIAPLHYKARRYCVVYTLMRLCQDKIGAASLEVPEYNKYLILFQAYRKELSELKPELTYDVLAGDVDEPRDRANTMTGVLYRS